MARALFVEDTSNVDQTSDETEQLETTSDFDDVDFTDVLGELPTGQISNPQHDHERPVTSLQFAPAMRSAHMIQDERAAQSSIDENIPDSKGRNGSLQENSSPGCDTAKQAGGHDETGRDMSRAAEDGQMTAEQDLPIISNNMEMMTVVGQNHNTRDGNRRPIESCSQSEAVGNANHHADSSEHCISDNVRTDRHWQPAFPFNDRNKSSNPSRAFDRIAASAGRANLMTGRETPHTAASSLRFGQSFSRPAERMQNPWQPALKASQSRTELPSLPSKLPSHAYPPFTPVVVDDPPREPGEMGEVLQSLTRTWSKFEAESRNDVARTKKELEETQRKCIQLSDELQAALRYKVDHMAKVDADRNKLSALHQRFDCIRAMNNDLASEIDTLRRHSHSQQLEIDHHRDELHSFNQERAVLVRRYAQQSRKSQSLMHLMLKVMTEMQDQVREYRLQGDYLLQDLGDKSGQLVEVRDELALTRRLRHSSAIDTAKLTTAVETAQLKISDRLERLINGSSANILVQTLSERLQSFLDHYADQIENGTDVSEVMNNISRQLHHLGTTPTNLPIRVQEVLSTTMAAHFSEQSNKLKDHIDSLQSNHERENSLHERITTLTANLHDAEKRSTEAVREKEELLCKDTVMQQNVRLLEEKLDRCTTRQSPTRAIVDKRDLAPELRRAQDDLEAAREQLEELTIEKHQAQDSATNARVDAAKANAFVDNLQLKINMLQQELEDVKAAQAQSATKFLAESRAALDNEKRTSDAERQHLRRLLQAACDDSKKDHEELQKVVDERNELDGLLDRASDELRDAEGTIAELKAKIVTLTEQQNNLVASEAALRSRLTIQDELHERAITDLENERLAQDAQRSSLEVEKAQMQTLFQDAARHREEITTLRTACTEKDIAHQQFKDDVDRMWKGEEQEQKRAVDRLNDAINEQTAKCVAAEHEVQQLHEQLQTARETIAHLEVQLAHETVVVEAMKAAVSKPNLTNPQAEEDDVLRDTATPQAAVLEAVPYLSTASKQTSQPPVDKAHGGGADLALPKLCGIPRTGTEQMDVRTPSGAHDTLPSNGDARQVKHVAVANSASKIFAKPSAETQNLARATTPAFLGNVPPMTPTDKATANFLYAREHRRIWKIREEANTSSDPTGPDNIQPPQTSFVVVNGTPVGKHIPQITPKLIRNATGDGIGKRFTTVPSMQSISRAPKSKKRKYDDRFDQELNLKLH